MELCTLFSGSSGNCTYIGDDKTRLLIDAGKSASAIETALSEIGVEPTSINGILVTHEHSDHVLGLAAFSRRYNVPVYANLKTWLAMGKKADSISSKNIKICDTGGNFYVDGFAVHSFSVPHDAADTVGYCVYALGRKVSTLTDLGYFPSRIVNEIEKSDIVLLESNHDIDMLKKGRYPARLKNRILSTRGHLSNEIAGNAAIKLFENGVRHFLLGHLSGENNTEELAFSTVSCAFETRGVKVGKDVFIGMTHRDKCGKVYRL